jgi:6-phosphogluconate dehydrogenase
MQIICEAFHLMRSAGGMDPAACATVFNEYNKGDLDSFLIEITADILRQNDPATGGAFVDIVLDAAGQKGTGMWTSIAALQKGAPAATIAEAVCARAMSALKEERVAASGVLPGPSDADMQAAMEQHFGSHERLIEAVGNALYCAKLCAYAQGFQIMSLASKEYDWELDFGSIAMIWRGGCIIRARFLQRIKDAYGRDASLANLLLDPYFAGQIEEKHADWRRVVSLASEGGLPVPAFASALSYYDSYRHAVLPANLLQAQRDYFGAHTYERTDHPRGKKFHLDWPDPDRPQSET